MVFYGNVEWIVHFCLVQLKTPLCKMYNWMNFVMHIHSQNHHHNQDNTYVHYFQKLACVLSRTSFTPFPTQPSPSHRPMIYFLTQAEKHFLEFRVNGIMLLLRSFSWLRIYLCYMIKIYQVGGILWHLPKTYVKSSFRSLHNSPMILQTSSGKLQRNV